MLSSPDADLCRRDPALPGLQTLLDPEALTARVAAASACLPLERFVPSYLRYKPETNCLVGFTSPDSPQAISFYGKVYSPNSGKPKGHAAGRGVEPGRVLLGSDGIDLFFFPTDNRLKLNDILNGSAMWTRVCRELRRKRLGSSKASFTVLAYRPERRCVLAMVVDNTPVAVLKAYAPAEFRRTSARARALRTSGSKSFPVLLVEDEPNRCLVFSWMPGEVLQRSLEKGSHLHSELAQTGAELAALHRLDAPALDVRGSKVESDHVHRVAAMVERLSPNLAEGAATIAGRISGALEKMPAGDCTLHGDFGAKQVVAKGESIAFLDFDEAARGRAATDLGNFVARLEDDVLRGKIPAESVAPARAALLGGYESAGTLPPDRELALYTAIGLFRVAHEPFRRHETEWPSRMGLYLDRVSALLDDADTVDASTNTRARALSQR